MLGSRAGGILTRDTNYEKYGRDYYKRLGAKGGARSHTGGFWYMKHVLGDTEAIRIAGAIGGRTSRRRKAQSPKERADKGAVTVYDRRRGLVVSDQAA